MEISAPELRPHESRTALLVASGVVAIGLVLLLIVAAGLLSKPSSADAKSARASEASRVQDVPEPKRPTLTRAQTSVLVLNAKRHHRSGRDRGLARCARAGTELGGTGNTALT